LTRSAFCKARRKLRCEAFVEVYDVLNDMVVRAELSVTEINKAVGARLIRVELPESEVEVLMTSLGEAILGAEPSRLRHFR